MRVNSYELLKDTLNYHQGDIDAQADAVYTLFLKNIADVDGVVYLDEVNDEFIANHELGEGRGSTPSEAVANLITNLGTYC